MGIYSLHQWLAFFFLYCFLGWCFETTYVSVKKKHFVNRGFLHGPMLPIYGSGACIILFSCLPVRQTPVLVFLFGMLAASALEYATGAAMEAIFKVRYWDYSECFLNLNGHICFKATVTWGAFSLLMTYVIQNPVEGVVLSVDPAVLTVCVNVILAAALVDYGFSLRRALDVRAAIIALEKGKERLARLEEQLDEKLDDMREDAVRIRKELHEAMLLRLEDKRSEARRSYMKRVNEIHREYFSPQGIDAQYPDWEELEADWDQAADRIREQLAELVRRNPSARIRRLETVRRELADDLKVFLESLREDVSDLKEGVAERVNDLKEDVAERVNDLKEDVAERVSDLKEDVAERMSDLKEDMAERVSGLKEAAEEPESDRKGRDGE